MAVEILMLTKNKASEYLGCSVEELEKWVKPDRVLPYDGGNPAARGMRLWSGTTLDAAKPHVEAWRERDKALAELGRRKFEAQSAAQAARRKGMLKAGAIMATKVCETLSCTQTELNRWAKDGRLPPDGEIFVYGGGSRKSLNARAWLPSTIEAAKDHVAAWREQDNIVKIARRRKLKVLK